MIRHLNVKLNRSEGFTLLEVVMVMFISSIVFTGMMISYVEGIKYTRENSSLMTLYNEGVTAMELMGEKIRHCGRARISSYGGARDALLELDYLSALGGGEVVFYFSKINKQLKWNNTTNGQSRLHMTLLPMLDFDTGPYEEPYLKVKNMQFIPLDHLGVPSPTLEGYSLIKIEMVLEDDRGDTLYLSSVHSKRNQL